MTEDTPTIVAFDIDGTLVTDAVWRRMHEMYGLPEAIEDTWQVQYHSKKIGFREWLGKVSAFYLQNPRTRAETQAVYETIEFQPHAEDVIGRLKSKYALALITSSQEHYAATVARRLGIERVYSFSYDAFDSDEKFAGTRFHTDGHEGDAKVDALKDLGKTFGCEASDIVFVGDSRNDLEAFTYTGRGVLIGEGNEEMRAAAWKKISALDELLTFL